MYGEVETSMKTRYFIWAVHIVILGIVTWMYFGSGIEIIGQLFGLTLLSGNTIRRMVLLAFGIVFFLRMTLTKFYLLKRKMHWNEAIVVSGAITFYQFGYALLGATQSIPIDYLDFIGIGIFILGSFLNTGSELQRKRFKDRSENKEKLYTDGLFKFARHINYFGDTVWAIGWAILTRNWWAAIMPVLCTANFVFYNIPMLSKYLEKRYKEQYREWARKTKKFIPFIY